MQLAHDGYQGIHVGTCWVERHGMAVGFHGLFALAHLQVGEANSAPGPPPLGIELQGTLGIFFGRLEMAHLGQTRGSVRQHSCFSLLVTFFRTILQAPRIESGTGVEITSLECLIPQSFPWHGAANWTCRRNCCCGVGQAPWQDAAACLEHVESGQLQHGNQTFLQSLPFGRRLLLRTRWRGDRDGKSGSGSHSSLASRPGLAEVAVKGHRASWLGEQDHGLAHGLQHYLAGGFPLLLPRLAAQHSWCIAETAMMMLLRDSRGSFPAIWWPQAMHVKEVSDTRPARRLAVCDSLRCLSIQAILDALLVCR
mmetsp:Transcript_70051/g.164343  ORF Transcript_70051/g.164343 Transcript_70051/m.164343 type:complete len:310 (-) Transcript_70051:1676-2605(-)